MMATYPDSDFPGSLDTDIPEVSGSDSQNAAGKEHAALHNAVRRAILATQSHVKQGITVANVQTADYTAVLADAGKVIELNKATAIALTIPPASSVAWPTGTVIGVYQAGVGSATVTAGAGVTIRNLAALRGQYAEASLRYRGSDEWVLEGDLASAAAPALKDYAEAQRTSGNLTLNSSSVAAVTTAMDLTLTAATGDLIEFGLTGLLGAAASTMVFDVYTMPGGTPTNPFSVGLDLATIMQGVPGWEVLDTESHVARLQGSVTRTLVSGDISGGTVTLRLYYRMSSGTGRTLNAASTVPFKVWAKNYGQV